ncbi:MAG: glycosyltransferase [Chloroflexi bacterium]|jgi:glycosyltransferase involved in cell wall biosynthesis|nr:glycosyltransferase [Chloroflexota bacterium]
MIRILFVDHAEALGGAERSLLLLLEHLDRTRFQPVLACNSGPLADAARGLGVQVEPVPMPRLRREAAAPMRLWQGTRALIRLVRRERIDLVHSNVMRASFYASLAAWLTGRPLIWHVRDVFAPGAYVRWMDHRAAVIIAISEATANPLPPGKLIHLIPNGVDVAEFDLPLGTRERVRRELQLEAAAPVVGLVGRLRPWKGQRDFLRAMALVRERHPQARFLVVGGSIFGGDEGYRAELEALARELGLGEAALFTGQREDLPALLSALDVLVHCSVEPEPFGRVMIEGMAARLPVVAYRHGGAGEIVVDQETGLLVPPGDVQALGQAVAALLADPVQAERLGLAGRRRVEERYDVRPLTRRVEHVFASIAQKWGKG